MSNMMIAIYKLGAQVLLFRVTYITAFKIANMYHVKNEFNAHKFNRFDTHKYTHIRICIWYDNTQQFILCKLRKWYDHTHTCSHLHITEMPGWRGWVKLQRQRFLWREWRENELCHVSYLPNKQLSFVTWFVYEGTAYGIMRRLWSCPTYLCEKITPWRKKHCDIKMYY